MSFNLLCIRVAESLLLVCLNTSQKTVVIFTVTLNLVFTSFNQTQSHHRLIKCILELLALAIEQQCCLILLWLLLLCQVFQNLLVSNQLFHGLLELK